MTSRIAPVGIVGLVACAAALGGCAFTDRHLKLAYPPSAEEAHVMPSADAGPVSVAVVDGRSGDVGCVGHVKNGFGMDTADVRIAEDPVPWVRGALEHELQAAGVQVQPAQDGVPRVRVRITRIECTAYLKYEGHVDLTAECDVAGAAPRVESVAGQGGAGMNWTGTETAYAETLALALQDAARNLAKSVRASLQRVAP